MLLASSLVSPLATLGVYLKDIKKIKGPPGSWPLMTGHQIQLPPSEHSLWDDRDQFDDRGYSTEVIYSWSEQDYDSGDRGRGRHRVVCSSRLAEEQLYEL